MTHRARHWVPLAAVLVMPLALPAGEASAAPPPPLWQACDGGPGDISCDISRGIAADPASGHLYVADSANDRIVELTAWGEFVEAWGWDVIASGPGDDTTAPEDQFEICLPANGDTCKAGVKGGGAGQLVRPQGVAVDSAGDVYVAEGDFNNRRVQKFDSEGHFVLMLGGKVNQTKVEGGAPVAQQNLCPVDPGDVCQAASEGTGPGEFGDWVAGSYIAVGPAPDETLYVGDEGRIEEFEPDGTYKGNLPDPEGLLSAETVQSLAADASGNLYVALSDGGSSSEPDALKLGSGGARQCTIEAHNPLAIAIDPNGGVYVVDAAVVSSDPDPIPTQVRHYSSSCAEDASAAFGSGEFSSPTGIAASGGACFTAGKTDLYVSDLVAGTSFVRAFGSPPDKLDSEGNPVCPPPPRAPTITGQRAESVDTESAVLRAEINSHFWPDTTYYVEYGTADCKENPGACQSKVLFPGAALETGIVDSSFLTPTVFLGGLEPDTTYHYRFLAESGGGVSIGEGEDPEDNPEERGGSFTTYPPALEPKICPANQVFRSGPSALLPDCRAYEMVSPVDKEGGEVDVVRSADSGSPPARLDQGALDGESLTYSSSRAFGEPASAPFTSQYLAHRESGEGWSNEAISPSRDGPSVYDEKAQTPVGGFGNRLDTLYKGFSEDLCESFLLADTEPLLGPGAVAGFANAYRREDCGAGAGSFEALLGGGEAPPTIAPDDFTISIQGFSADGSHAVFRASGKLTEEGTAGTTQLYEHYDGDKLRLVCVLPDETPSAQSCSAGTPQSLAAYNRHNSVEHAVSADGSRIFWSPSPIGEGPGPLYVRIGGTETIEISANTTARFRMASADGSVAIFTVGNPEGGASLREFDLEEEATTEIAKGVRGVLGASEDASRIYFVSSEALGGENGTGDEAQAGKPNLYLYEAGEGEGEATYTFIATLAGKDADSKGLSSVALSPYERMARVSKDGSYALFASYAPLTGYDNTDLLRGEADTEVFLYGAASGKLVCVSCNPSGARPAGGLVLGLNGGVEATVAGRIRGWEYQLHAGRNLSAGGDRVFFESFEGLVLRDANGKQDVYEWERAASKAGCEALGAELYVAASGGCISLISSGESAADSEFIDASADGRDVFIGSQASLVSQDPGLLDIYDARAGGGLPPPAAPSSPCEGDSCQSPASPPNDQTPASAAFHGQGSSSPRKPRPRCAKGEVRRKGRCAAKKKKKHKRQSHANHKRRATR